MTLRPSSRRSATGAGARARGARIAPPFEPVPVLALSGPSELIDSVPYLLGFHPRDSLVLVGLGSTPAGRDRVGVSARVDLADLAVDAGIVRRCAAALGRSGAHSAVVLVYDSEAAAAPALPWSAIVEEVGAALELERLSLRDALLVGDTRWWSYLCSDPACCPAEGSPRQGPGSATAATAAYAGLSALPGREGIEALLDQDPPEALERMAVLLEVAEAAELEAVLTGRQQAHRRSATRALFAAARAQDLNPLRRGAPGQAQPAPTDEQAARLAVALGDLSVRDACWLAAEGGRLPATGLWRMLARRLPAPYDAQPLFLLGWQEWRAGNGALAGIAASRALASDPGCSAARLLLDALAHGLDPRSAPRLRSTHRGAPQSGGTQTGGTQRDGTERDGAEGRQRPGGP